LSRVECSIIIQRMHSEHYPVEWPPEGQLLRAYASCAKRARLVSQLHVHIAGSSPSLCRGATRWLPIATLDRAAAAARAPSSRRLREQLILRHHTSKHKQAPSYLDVAADVAAAAPRLPLSTSQ
jgi:hypothetical protein